jgi:hypothetical protein
MNKIQDRNEELPQPEDLLVWWIERSEDLLTKVLTDDFCEFGSSEVIGLGIQQRFAG